MGTGVAWIVANRFGQKRNGAAVIATALSGSGAAGWVNGAQGENTSRGAMAMGGVGSFLGVTTSGVFLYFLKIGALLFGSGYEIGRAHV